MGPAAFVFTHTTGGKTETATFNAVRFPSGEDNPWEDRWGQAPAALIVFDEKAIVLVR